MIAGWWLIAGILFAFVSGLFASLVLSLHTISRIRIAPLLQEIERESITERIKFILEDIQGHAAALAFIQSVFQFATALCMIYWAASMQGQTIPTGISIAVGIAASLILLWIIGTLVPMGVAQYAGEQAVIRFALPIRVIHTIFVPALPFWRFTNEVVRRLAGTDQRTKDLAITGSDLRSIVADNEVEDKLDEAEREMLEAVVEFRSTFVEQIMTPRTEINALEYTDDLDQVQRFINEHGHSRHPVYSENLDHIEGMLYVKDLLKWIINHGNNGKPFILSEILREPSFVPETKTVRELLAQLLADQVHIAIILDEYGGTSGLVTVEDIVEEIFGEIQDEYEEPESADSVTIDQDASRAEIDARTEIDDANDQLETLGIVLPESDDYDTVGGFINTILGRIPEQGEEFSHQSLHFEILEAEPTRVVRLRVSCAPETDHQLVDTEAN